MEILTSAVQSYQSNQNLAGWVAETEKQTPLSGENNDLASPDDDLVHLGERHRIYDWIAQSFPPTSVSPENVHRTNQMLFEYNLLSLSDIHRANAALADNPENLSLNDRLKQSREHSGSYLERQQLDHLIQVYATLEAAAEKAAA